MQIDTVISSTEIVRSFGVRLDDIDYTSYFTDDWSVTHDADAAFATGTFPVARPFSLPEGRHTIRLYAGWNGRVDLAFSGEIVATDDTYYPARTTLQAGGFLKRLEAGLDVAKAFYSTGGTPEETQALLDAIGSDYQAVPIATDADLIIHVLETYGITPQTTNHSIAASPWIPSRIAPIFWEPGTPGWQLISEIDRITTHRTYDGRTGAVYRRQLLGTVPFGRRHTFTKGVDILDLGASRDYRVFNQVIVRGAMIASTGEQVEGVSPVGGPQPSPYVPTPPGTRTDEQVRSDYIETVEDAQLLADLRLGLVKQPLQQFPLTTFGCPDIDVGDALAVASDLLTTNAFVVQHRLSGVPLRSAFVLRGSTVAEARPNQPPVPALTVAQLTERVIVAGQAQPLTILQIDASASSDPDGQIASYLIQVDGQSYTTPTATHPHLGSTPATVTLTVTDDVGLSATLTQDVPIAASTAIYEPIHVAEATQAEATVDGEQTWRSFTAPVTAVAPIAQGGATCYGCADGKLYRSTDDLQTAPQLVTTFPSAVTCLWNNELLTSRWLAGLQNGDVWQSIDAGQTWTRIFTFAAPVNDLSESPYAANQMSACSGASFWTTFDGQTWTAQITRSGQTCLRFAAGPFTSGRAWAGFADGVIQATDGATLTLPTPAEVRGLTLARTREELYIFTNTTATYTWTPAGGLQSGATTGTASNRAIRSGAADFVYTAEDGAVGKWFASGQRYDVRIMTSPQRALAVGYRPAVRPSSTGVAEVLLLTRFQATGGVWHFVPGSGWTLKNSGLPQGASIVWLYVTADPFNPNRWLLLGNTSENTEYAPPVMQGGNYCMNGTTTPALWLTNDAGSTWSPVQITAPSGLGGNRQQRIEWSDDPITSGAWVSAIGADKLLYGSGSSGQFITNLNLDDNRNAIFGLNGQIIAIGRRYVVLRPDGTIVSVASPATVREAYPERFPGTNRALVQGGNPSHGAGVWYTADYGTQPTLRTTDAARQYLQPLTITRSGALIAAAAGGVVRFATIATSTSGETLSTNVTNPTSGGTYGTLVVRSDRQTRSAVAALINGDAQIGAGALAVSLDEGQTWTGQAGPDGAPVNSIRPVLEILRRA